MTTNIELSKQSSILNGHTYYEVADLKIIKALLQSEHLAHEWGSSYIEREACRYTKNEREQLEKYMKKYDRGIKMVAVNYKKSKHGYGRNFVLGSLGFTGFRKLVRNTLLKDNYYDFDLENAQVEIIRNIVTQNPDKFPKGCPLITHYCNNRKQILEELSVEYNVTPKNVKQLFLSVCFGGSFYGWIQEYSIMNAFPTDFIVNYIKEISSIMIVVKKENPSFYKTISQSCDKKGKEDNKIGSFFATYLQEHENVIIEKIITWLDNVANVITDKKTKKKVLTYEFDGIKLYKPFVDAYEGGKTKLLQDLNNALLELTGFEIVVNEKPIDEFYNIESELELIENNEMENINSPNSFEYMCEEFEKRHFKIVDSGLYIEETEDNKIHIRTPKQLTDCYNHLAFMDIEGKTHQFINKWVVANPSIRKYESMDIYPNNVGCPETTYNLWRPFDMELVTEYKEEPDKLAIILNHFKILCNNDDNVYNYVMYFIAHMIQRPYEKPTTCLHFQSSEGAGKSTIIELLTKVMGLKKVFTTAEPNEYVWGRFNPMMRDPILIVLEELEKKYLTDKAGVFKNLITNPILTIQDKAKTPFDIKSFHRFMSFTNKEEAGVTTSKNDRRNLIIKCSDELIGNKQYFSEFYDMIKDINVIKTFYDYLKSPINFPEIANFINMKLPHTEIQETLKELSRSYYDLWVEEIVKEYSDDSNGIVSISSYDCYAKFCSFLKSNGSDFKITNVKFGVNLKLLNLDGLSNSKKKDGNYWVFDIEKLMVYYKLQ